MEIPVILLIHAFNKLPNAERWAYEHHDRYQLVIPLNNHTFDFSKPPTEYIDIKELVLNFRVNYKTRQWDLINEKAG